MAGMPVVNGYVVSSNPRVTCVHEPTQAVTQVMVHGGWGHRLRDEVSWVLRACVAETPRVLLVDAARLDDPAGESAATWRIAARYAAESDPPISVIVCAAAGGLRRRLATGGVEQVPSMAAGLAAVARADDRAAVTHHVSLPAQHGVAALARTMAADTCVAFALPHLDYPARLIVSELVGNAVEHAGTNLDVWVSMRGAMVHLAVQDRSPALPPLLDARPGNVRAGGMGLRIVAATATAWGALPCAVGKVVWATLATRLRRVS
ncbi:ATP-binding protein [Actinoplanes sp. NPDC049548]|uniref:ATP-binding protein n=1 Tax=Actinoplanes sp. NPDC049548 TaxID=3155152 RepID=UPI00342E19E7